MYKSNEKGWFPVFRVLHLFQSDLYESEKIKKKHEMAQELLKTLFKLDYDFTKPSEASHNDIEKISTFEMLLTVPVDQVFFKQILAHIWNYPSQQQCLLDMAMQVMKQDGHFVDFLYEINSDTRTLFLNEMSAFLNQRKIMENKQFRQ